MKVLAALDDLIFQVRIGDAAKRAGVDIQFVRTEADLFRLAAGAPDLIILDLNCRSFAPLSAARRLKSEPQFARSRVIGYISHVQTELRREAVTTGLDQVLARSAFVDKLPQILTGELPKETADAGPDHAT